MDNHLKAFALGLMLAHDAFWLMDRVSDRRLAQMRREWDRLTEEAGWTTWPSDDELWGTN